MPSTTRPLFDQIDSWLQEVDQKSTKSASAKAPAKKAAVKKAAPEGMGKSTHPSDDVDDNTHAEQTGARYSENSADVKKDVPGQSVDETEKGPGCSQDEKQYNIGTEQSSVGEDPSVEDDYKGTKDDPGTTHPCDAEDVGEKYSSMHLNQLLKLAENQAHEILADISASINAPAPKKEATVAEKAAATKVAQTATTDKAASDTAKAGYDAASMTADLEKQASDFVAQAIRDANTDADLVGPYLVSYYNNRYKKAADEGSHDEGEQHEGPPAEEESAGPPVGGEGGGGDVLSALGAGGAGGPPGGGGDPGGAMPPPPGGGGVMPPPDAAAGGGAEGGMGQEQALQELVMALQELGISPEELAQIAQSSGAGGPPGMGGPPPGAGAPPMGGPPGMGGPPPMGDMTGGGGAAMPPDVAKAASAELTKLASYAKNYMRSGKFRYTEAKTASQEKARTEIKDYIRELAGIK